MSVFDLKKFLVENKITRNSKLRESDDFEFTDTDKDLATNLNAKILKIGDTITPDMWNPNTRNYEFYSSDSWIIKNIYEDEGKYFVWIEAKAKISVEDINDFNNSMLKPQYYINTPNDVRNVNEADDDFEFTDLDKDLANKLSNEVELKIGDTITPDMWGDKQKFINAYYDWFGEEGWFGLKFYNKTIQDSYLIQSMFFAEGDEDFEADWIVSLNSTTTGKSFNIMEESTPLKILNSLLKDNYKIYPSNMNESDDFEFTDADKDLANQLDLESDLKKTFLELWNTHLKENYLSLLNTDVIYHGLDKVLKDPDLKNKVLEDAYNRIAGEDFESEEERYNDFQGSVIDEIDFNVMAEFAPQLARNLLTAGFKYNSDTDMWTSPNTNTHQWSSYGIIWDVWGVDYDTNIRETISEYLENAAQELT